MMHEKEDVVYLNKNSYFQKIVSSIVLVSFLSMTVTQTYAMTEGLEHSGPRPGSASSKVAPAPIFEQGDIQMGQLPANSQIPNLNKPIDPRKVIPIDASSVLEDRILAARVDQAEVTKVDEQKLGTILASREDAAPEDTSSQKRLLEDALAAQIDDDEDADAMESGKLKSSEGNSSKAEEDDECSDEKTKAFIKDAMRGEVSTADFRKAMGALVLTLALGYVIRSEVNWWIDSFLNQFDTTDIGFRFVYINPYGNYFFNQLENWDIANLALTLTPYIYKRSFKFIDGLADTTTDYLWGSGAKSSVQTKYSPWIEWGGTVGAFVAASSVAGSGAFQLYSGTVLSSASIAMTATPFLAAFLLMDNSLRFNDLKHSIFTLLFISMAATWANLKGKVVKTDEDVKAAETKLAATHKDEENHSLLDKAYEEAIKKAQRLSDEEIKARVSDINKLKGKPIKQFKVLMGKKVQVASQTPQPELVQVSNQLTLEAKDQESVQGSSKPILAIEDQKSSPDLQQKPIKGSQKLGIGTKEAADLLQFHKNMQQEEARRNRRRWAGYGLGGALAGLAAYLTFLGTQSVADAGLQASIPGNVNQLGAENYHSFYEAQYRVWREETSDIRTGNLTSIEVGNGTYVDVNAQALDEWWADCVNSAESYQYVNNSLGASVFSFGYNCPGNSYQNTWSANPGDLNRDMGLIWYRFIDGDFSGQAGIKDENTDDYELIHITPLKMSPGDKGAADTISGIRAASSGALTFKSVAQALNPDETLLGASGGIFINNLYETLTTNPCEVLTSGNLAKLGWAGLSVLGVLAILGVSSIESLIYASPTAMAAWVSESGMSNQSLMWTLVSSTGLATAINVFPDFKETYSSLPHDLAKVLHYTGILEKLPEDIRNNIVSRTISSLTGISSQKSSTYYKREFIEILKTLRAASKSVKPEIAQTMVDVLGLGKVVRKRR